MWLRSPVWCRRRCLSCAWAPRSLLSARAHSRWFEKCRSSARVCCCAWAENLRCNTNSSCDSKRRQTVLNHSMCMRLRCVVFAAGGPWPLLLRNAGPCTKLALPRNRTQCSHFQTQAQALAQHTAHTESCAPALVAAEGRWTAGEVRAAESQRLHTCCSHMSALALVCVCVWCLSLSLLFATDHGSWATCAAEAAAAAAAPAAPATEAEAEATTIACRTGASTRQPVQQALRQSPSECPGSFESTSGSQSGRRTRI